MADILSLSINTLTRVSSLCLNPLVPASVLAALAYTPPDVLRQIRLLAYLDRFIGRRLVVDGRDALRLLVVAGLARFLTRAANAWALNNWRLTAHGGWRWQEEVAVVTGGCNGIGKAIVLSFARRGVKVAILDKEKMPFDLQKNPLVKYWNCDITSASAISAAAEEIRQSLGHPSILVNNAGVAYTHSILDTDDESLQTIFGVNLLSLWSTAKEFLPHMIQEDKGHIVTIASMASFSALPTAVDYSATKVGALAFNEGLSCEIKHMYKSRGVLTTVVHPMWVKTNMTAPHAERVEKTYGQMMQPDDVARLVTKQVFSRRGGQLIIPDTMSWASLNRGLSSWIQELMRDAIGREAAVQLGH